MKVESRSVPLASTVIVEVGEAAARPVVRGTDPLTSKSPFRVPS